MQIGIQQWCIGRQVDGYFTQWSGWTEVEQEPEDTIREQHPDVVSFFVDVGGATPEEIREVDERFRVTIDEVRDLDGAEGVPARLRGDRR